MTRNYVELRLQLNTGAYVSICNEKYRDYYNY